MHKLVPVDVFPPQHRVHAELASCPGVSVVTALAQEDDGSESRPARQVPGPIDPAAAGPAVGEQHGIKRLCEELGGERPFDRRVANDELRIRPQRREPLPDETAEGVFFFDQQQAHGHAKITTRAGARMPARWVPACLAITATRPVWA